MSAPVYRVEVYGTKCQRGCEYEALGRTIKEVTWAMDNHYSVVHWHPATPVDQLREHT